MDSKIKVIVFDLGGVILDLNKQACIDALVGLGFTDVSDYLGQYSQKGAFLEMEDGRISADQFYDFVREHTSPETTDEQIRGAFFQFIVELPVYRLEMLRLLRDRYKVCLLSNTNPVMFAHYIPSLFTQEGYRIEDYFDEFFLSYKMGVTKPHLDIFEQMVARLGVEPEEILFLDDSAKNCEAAAQLGISTYKVDEGIDYRTIFE